MIMPINCVLVRNLLSPKTVSLLMTFLLAKNLLLQEAMIMLIAQLLMTFSLAKNLPNAHALGVLEMKAESHFIITFDFGVPLIVHLCLAWSRVKLTNAKRAIPSGFTVLDSLEHSFWFIMTNIVDLSL